MKTKLISGTKYYNEIFNQIKTEISELHKTYHELPGLAFIGLNSNLYQMKNSIVHIEKFARDLGFKTQVEMLSHKTDDRNLSEVIVKHKLNPKVHAIAVLHPCPNGLIPAVLSGLLRNALTAFKKSMANKIKRHRKQLPPFSLLRNYNLIRSEFALLQGN